MNYFIIGPIVLISFIVAHFIIYFFEFLLGKKLKRKNAATPEASAGSRDANKQDFGKNLLVEAFFEHKENTAVFENLYELLKNEPVPDIKEYLKKIRALKIIDASKINSLSKKECELLDKLYLVMINKMKLEFNFELYKAGKLTLLELRAKTRQYQDEAKEADIAYFNRLVDL